MYCVNLNILCAHRFCGKIEKIAFNADTKSADIHFEKASAAKTALMLNGGTLDGAHLTVTSPTEHPDHEEAHHEGPIEQTDKPRAGIAAEYLAKGYKLSDGILQRAIEIDTQKGISKRFLSYMQGLDTTLGQKTLGPDQTISGKVSQTFAQAHEQAKTIDQQKGISSKAGDVRLFLCSRSRERMLTCFCSTTHAPCLRRGARRSCPSTPRRRSKSSTSTKKPDVLHPRTNSSLRPTLVFRLVWDLPPRHSILLSILLLFDEECRGFTKEIQGTICALGCIQDNDINGSHDN